MNLEDILTPEYTLCNAPGGSKKRTLEYLSHFMADRIDGFDADQLYQHFLSRERIGSTGIGQGIAIPHCRMEGCEKITGALLKLDSPVDFDAIDDQPVDLVFALIVPNEKNEAHLQTLSSIAQLLQDSENIKRLRQASTSSVLFKAALQQPLENS